MAPKIGHNSKPAVTNVNALSVEDRKKLKGFVQELNDSLTRAAAERELQKEIVIKASEELGLDKKLVSKMGKVYFRANFNDEIESHNMFEEFYSTIILENPKILKTDGWSNK